MPPPTPKLNYDITPDKSPLYTTVDQLNQSTADLTVSATNARKAPITIKAIQIELTKVAGGADTVQLVLPGSAGGIGFPTSFIGPHNSAWTVTGSDGVFTLMPDEGTVTFSPGAKLSFTLQNVAIREGGNGTALVPVIEETDQGKTQTEVGIGITQSTLNVQLSADNTLIAPGQTITLKWTTQDATSGVLVMPGSSPDKMPLNSTNLASGQQSFTPIADTTYTLTCQGKGPDVSQFVPVSIQEVQIINFSSSVSAFSAADIVTLSWQTLYASSCAVTTKEGSGSVKVPVLNNQTASCQVRATPDGTKLILSKSDGTGELGRLTLPTPCPSSITFLLAAGGSPNPKQAQWVVNLLQVQINSFNQSVSSQTSTSTYYPPPQRWVDPNADPPEPVTTTTTTYMLQLTWNVSNAGAVSVACNGGQVSTASTGTWQSGYDYGSPPSGTITCQGFGGPIGH